MNKNFVAAALLASCAALPVSAVTLTSDFTMGVEATIEQNFKLVTHSDNSSSATVTLGKWDEDTGHAATDLRMKIVGTSGKNITLSVGEMSIANESDPLFRLALSLDVLRADGKTMLGSLDVTNVVISDTHAENFIFRVGSYPMPGYIPGSYKGDVVITAAQPL